MNSSLLRRAAALIVTATLAACGGGSGGGALPSGDQTLPMQPSFNTPSVPQALTAFDWGKPALQKTGAMLIGTADKHMTVGMQVLVNMKDPAGLIRYAQAVSDPTSGSYRQFLTPQQIADRFAASTNDYGTAAAYFQKYGLRVSGWPQREAIYVNGAVGEFEQAFGTTFGIWRQGNAQFIAPTTAPHTSVAVPIRAVLGMIHAQLAHNYLVPNAQLRGYTLAQEQRAFDFTGPATRGINGAGINIGIVGTGPISPADAAYLSRVLNGARIATISQVDVTDQSVTAGLGKNPSPGPLPTPIEYPYSSGFKPAPPVTAPCRGSLPACNPEDIEAQLDTQTTGGMAPGSHVLFYLGYNPNDCFLATGVPQNNSPCPKGQGVPAEGISLTDPETQQIIGDNQADVVSMSFGFGEPLGIAGFIFSEGNFDANGFGYGPIEMASMVIEGMAVFASSGDTGAFACSGFDFAVGLNIPGNPPCVSYPSGDPNVVSVGGVTGPLNPDGTLRTQFTAWGFQTEAGGDGSYANNVGTGGGISTVFPAPPWQRANADIVALGHGMRTQPDISLMGDPNSGPTTVANAFVSPQVFAEGGTSLSAPQMAALWSLVLQACKQNAACAAKGHGVHPYRLGNPAPLLYAIYKNKTQYKQTVFDVLYGNIGANNPTGQFQNGFNAGPGYDAVTGIGVPLGGHLINTILTNVAGSNPNLP